MLSSQYNSSSTDKNFSQIRKIKVLGDDSLPAYSSTTVPSGFHTKRQWKMRRRKVRKGEKPVAKLQWNENKFSECERQENDGTITTWKEPLIIQRECGLFAEGQTVPYRGSRRTWAIHIYWQYLIRFASKNNYLWWLDEPLDGNKPGWRTCRGHLQEFQLKNHLKGTEKYGVRGGKWTRFGGIDLDLHEGDPAIFLEQFRVLLEEFHGKEGWHYQVSDRDAGGVHLIQTFRTPILVSSYREQLRKRLQRLDVKYPELVDRARKCGMKTLGELEIYPDLERGFRLPLCAGRTMLLDRPLEPVFNKRMKRKIPDVLGYVSWLSKDDRKYLEVEEVFQFVATRLKSQLEKGQEKKKPGRKVKKNTGTTCSFGSLGKMKGRFAQFLVDFWSGNLCVPDSLNQGIRLLALVLPFYLENQTEAIDLLEKYIDELPDQSFSDRLSLGNRAEVSRIIARTVHHVYAGNGGQPDPESSSIILETTVKAWKKRGFDPTDKNTWNQQSTSYLPPPSPFSWEPEEMEKLAQIQEILKTSLQVTSDAVKHFLHLVKHHRGEISVIFVKNLLVNFGIKCGHNGKANQFLSLLVQWDWVRITAKEQWHARNQERKGRARTYAIGKAMVGKFYEEIQGQAAGQEEDDYVGVISTGEEKK